MTGLDVAVASLPPGLSGAELARARQYLYGALAGDVAAQAGLVAVLAWIYYGGWGPRLAAWLRPRLRRPAALGAACGAAVAAIGLTALLPFDAWLGFFRERAYGFEQQRFLAWLGQWALSALLTALVVAAVAALAYGWGARARAARGWWLRLWLIVAAGMVVAVALDPILFEPLFHRFTPVENAAARQEIEQLAARAGIPHARILQMDASQQSSHENAYVTGMLGSQRIVVYDTLLRHTTPAELAFIVGHEIGHYVLGHLWKGVAFGAAYVLGLVALAGWCFGPGARGRAVADPATLALTLALLLGFYYLSAPVPNRFSRWEEHQADAYGLQLTGDGCAAAAGFRSEEHTDLVYPDPPGWIVFWFYNHPSQQARIDFALRSCAAPSPGEHKRVPALPAGPAPSKFGPRAEHRSSARRRIG